MKVILLQEVRNLGKIGEVVEVKDGYAHNFLMPNSLALKASSANVKIAEHAKKAQAAKTEKIKQDAADLAKKIAAASCTISMSAGEDEKLFGAVTSHDIADVLKQEGLVIDKKDIVLSQPIHKLGIYNVEIKLHPEITQELKVWVIKK
ncbi:MAG: 50S ribosomal protein L9 [Candidatus Omnitrophica bacterium]|nr:50S ribosomal protein L9 [Candidatus Omnitrophota bacterium]